MSIIEKCVSSFQSRIYIAGDYAVAKKICRDFCEDGFCVSISKVDYIYKLGEESGVEIKLINYPRFPKSEADIKQKAASLSVNLLFGLNQGSLTIVNDDSTVFMSRREVDLK